MGDDDRKTLENVLERGFDRMETRFDGLAAEIKAHGTAIAVVQAGCARHLVDDDKRDKRISSLYRAVGEAERENSQVVAKPKAETTAGDLAQILDQQEERRAKRMRTWITLLIPAALALTGVPAVRSCLGERQTEAIAASVKALEARPATKVVVIPQPMPLPAPAPKEETP